MTPDSDALLALALRVEALTGPCRETDAQIASFLGWTELEYKNENVTIGRDPDGRWAFCIPKYTASIDAAMKLVHPMVISVSFDWPDGIVGASQGAILKHIDGLESRGTGATAASAITAAALRARALITRLATPQTDQGE